jgi:predicted RNase H-like nuclease
MADPNPRDCAERDTAHPAAQDAKAERTVLAFLINEHPNQLTIADVSWALNDGSVEFETEDAVERAVRELVGAGLLRCAEGFVLPTRAALYFARLEMD